MTRLADRLLIQVVEQRTLPLVGCYQHRRNRITRHDTHWLRLADDDAVWQPIPARLLRRLDLCTTRSQVNQLLRAVGL